MTDWLLTLVSAGDHHHQKEDIDGIDQWEALSSSNLSPHRRGELAYKDKIMWDGIKNHLAQTW